MSAETVLYANDSEIARRGIARAMEKYASTDGHVFLGAVASVEDLKTVLARGYKPTVFLLDPKFPTIEGGIEAIGYMKVMSPDTKIATLPSVEGTPGVDKEFEAPVAIEELLGYLSAKR